MLVGFAEGLGAAKTYAAREGYEIDVNRELVGLGAANAAAGLSSGMVVNGCLSKTAVNGGAGAHSQLSGLVVAVMLVDIPALRRLYGIYTRRLGRAYGVAARPDFIAAVAAMLGVMVFDTLPGLFIGIACSILLLIYRASRPRVARLGKVAGTVGHYSDLERHPEDVSPDGVAVLRVESGLFFANSDWVRERVRKAAGQKGIHAVVLDAENISFIDVSAVEMLEQLDRDLKRDGVRLLLARDTGQVRDVVRRATDDGDVARVFPTVQAAVDAAQRDGGGWSAGANESSSEVKA
jgi:anti-anti-sigma factor